MKKIFKITFIALLLFVGINKVDARSCSDITMYANSDFDQDTGVIMSYNNSKDKNYDYNYAYYVLKDAGGAAFSTYCRHAGKSTNQSYAGEPFVCEKSVFDTTSSSETQKAYDAGILAILENGHSTRSSKKYTLSDNQEMVATSIALRSYEMLWVDVNTNGGCDSTPWLNKVHMTFTNEYLNDPTITSLLQQAAGKTRSHFSCAVPVKSIKQGDSDISSTIKNEARRLIIEGLNAAINYKVNGAASVSWSNVSETILETTRSDGQKIYTKEASYTFNIKNFKSSGSYVNLIFDCPTCTSKGVDYTIYVNGNNLGTSLNKNLLDYVSNGTGTVNLKIVFTRNAYESECNSISYTLDIKYWDETIDTEAYEMRAGDCTAGVQCQHFYMLYATDNEKKENVYSSIEVCDCEELEDLCSSGNGKACNIINKDYEGKCVNCATEINNSVCTKDDSEIGIIEGHELDEDTCQRSAETNVRYCVINSKDEAGNSYQSNLINNEYCNVWCKEDYHITLPGQQEANSGRYFSLKASVSGSKTCYANKRVKYDDFIKILEVKRNKVNDEYYRNPSSSTYNSAVSDYVNAINNYNACSGMDTYKYDNNLTKKTKTDGWKMDYNFDPEIKFWYEESYMDNIHTDVLSTIGSPSKTSVKQEACLGETNDYYSSCTTGWVSSENTNANTNQRVCLSSGCRNYKIFISRANYIKQTISAEGSYITPTQFYTIYPTGAIAVSDKGNIENASPLENKLPIGLGTKNGVYNYTLIVGNLGEYYDSGKLGRLWGDKDSVVSILLNSQEPCREEGALQYEYSNVKDGVYVCAYKVNCPDCPVECDKDGCYWKDCPDNSCPVVCDGCVYSNGESNIDYRPITPEDVNPNDRDLGENWSSDDTIDTAMELKAHVTTEEIETYGDTVYDIDYSNDDDYAVEVTLDSKTISKIREYNDKYEDEGYLNNSLKCYDYVNNNDGTTYENIYCYSTFIDELLYDNNTKDNIKFTKNRVIGTNAKSSDNLRKTNTQSSGYWTTWSEAQSTNWIITTEKVLEYKAHYGTNINIGPSWK